MPSTAELMFQALISCMDTIMVGALGAAAIAGVGMATQLKFFLMAVIYALNVTITAVVARRKGEGDPLGMHRSLAYGIILAFSLSILTSVLGLIFAKDMLLVLGADSDYIAEGVTFLRIIVFGNVLAALSMAVNSALRGAGNAKVSMVSNIVANVVNVAMNYLLIAGHLGFPAWGVKGAAIATVLGNFASFIISFAALFGKEKGLSLQKIPALHWDKRTLRAFWLIGSGALIEQAFTRVGYLSYAAIVAGLGTIPFAAHSICLNLVDITFCLGTGVGAGASVTVGQNLGRNRKDIALMSLGAAKRIAFVSSAVVALAFLFWPREIIALFNHDPAVIAAGLPVMYILVLCSLFQPQMLTTSGGLRGAGDSRFVAFSTLAGLTVIRPVVALICCYPLGLGLFGAWLGMLFDHILRTFLNEKRCRGVKWLNIKV